LPLACVWLSCLIVHLSSNANVLGVADSQHHCRTREARAKAIAILPSHDNATPSHSCDSPGGAFLQEINVESRSRSQWHSQERDICTRGLYGKTPRRESCVSKQTSTQRSSCPPGYRQIWNQFLCIRTRHYSQCPARDAGIVVVHLTFSRTPRSGTTASTPANHQVAEMF